MKNPKSSALCTPEPDRRRGRGALPMLLASLLILTFAAGCGKKGAHFGPPFTDAPRATIAQLLDAPGDFSHKTVRVSGEIERQCPAAGCWLFLNDGAGRSIRVELGDYFEKLPRNVGHTAEVEGEWIPMGDQHRFIGTRIEFSVEPAP